MPPRYAYWTILVDDQPTAFRSASQEELMPTFNRLQQKHASAKMMWWQNGKLWNSRLDAQEAMRARGEIGRSRDVRQPALSERRPTASDGRRESKGGRYSDRAPSASERREERGPSGKLDWKPKGSASSHIAPGFSRGKPHEKPEWKPKGSFKPERLAKPDWKPKGSFKPKRSAAPDWKPKSSSSRPMPRSSRPPAAGKLEWAPKGESATRSRIPDPGSPKKRKWVPKAEYKKSLGIEAKKDKNWRPGGEHKDPRQKYKDAKKAKWGRFKQTVRKRWESKQGGKKKDE
jgi:hypothetical protein